MSACREEYHMLRTTRVHWFKVVAVLVLAISTVLAMSGTAQALTRSQPVNVSWTFKSKKLGGLRDLLRYRKDQLHRSSGPSLGALEGSGAQVAHPYREGPCLQ